MRAGLSELEAPFLAHGAIAANEALRFERMLREFDALTAPSHGEPKKG
jgi:hypothetical protein